MSGPGEERSKRRKAREAALQLLYEIEMRGDETLADLDRSLSEVDDREHAERLVRGVHAERTRIDEAIRKVALHWDLARMAALDRNLLRLSAYELLSCPDVPARVAIDEAVELAKRYGGADSPRFVNGLLDRIARESRGDLQKP